MKTGLNGLNLIKHFEGLRLEAYAATDAERDRGLWTIGYGHTNGVQDGDTCTPEQADAWLAEDVSGAEESVTDGIHVPIGKNQFDALVSFTYNCGHTNFQNSTLRRLVNLQDFPGAAEQFLRWNHQGNIILEGLTRRRAAERRLFLTPDDADFNL